MWASVIALADNAVAQSREADFANAARNMLARHLSVPVPDRDTISYQSSPIT